MQEFSFGAAGSSGITVNGVAGVGGSGGSSSGKMPAILREFLSSLDDKEWESELYKLLQSQSFNQVEVDLFKLLCKVLDHNLFAQVDWARNSYYFKELAVGYITDIFLLYNYHNIARHADLAHFPDVVVVLAHFKDAAGKFAAFVEQNTVCCALVKQILKWVIANHTYVLRYPPGVHASYLLGRPAALADDHPGGKFHAGKMYSCWMHTKPVPVITDNKRIDTVIV